MGLKNILKSTPFSLRIFIATLFLVTLSMSAIGALLFFQYTTTLKSYNDNRLELKDQNTIESLEYILSSTDDTNSGNVASKIGNSIYQIADLNTIDINLYSLEGNLILSNKNTDIVSSKIPDSIISKLKSLPEGNEKLITKVNISDSIIESSAYTYVRNNFFQPVAIIHLPHSENNNQFIKSFYYTIKRYSIVALIIILCTGLVAWFLSKNMTKKIKDIADILVDTDVLRNNEPIDYTNKDEITPLVEAYNKMVAKVSAQTRILAKHERDEAWKEMAKQVAHEIKNPLTPMKLEIQRFQMNLDKDNPDKEKVDKLTASMTQQIDTISAIAEAFAEFAKMPVKSDTLINVIKTIDNLLEILPRQFIKLSYNKSPILLNIDPSYLNRIFTNLTKNAMQAIPADRTPRIEIQITDSSDYVHFSIKDNGLGIAPSIREKIFTPQFTTKTSGSGLGLAMVKKIIEDYNGEIDFKSNENEGACFFFHIPKNHA